MSPKLSITAQKMSQAIAVGVSAACSEWGVAEDMMACGRGFERMEGAGGDANDASVPRCVARRPTAADPSPDSRQQRSDARGMF
jgi:hypothetical protein